MSGRFKSTPVVHESGYRQVLTSERLVPLWVEAADRLEVLEPSDAEWWRWRTALSALVSAMQAAEELAAAVDPRLGRRDWSERPTGLCDAAPATGSPTTRRLTVIPRQVCGATP